MSQDHWDSFAPTFTKPSNTSPVMASAEDLDLPVPALQSTPLEHTWCMWFNKKLKKQSPDSHVQGIQLINSFMTVEDFWW